MRSSVLIPSLFSLILITTAVAAPPPDLIQSAAAEQAILTDQFPDGGIPPVVGVQNIQVFRASRAVPNLTDGKGYTYNHHVDMAEWKTRLYLAWDNGEKDEDVWPARELFSTSADGFTWTPPAELFPQGVSTSLRMYFFHAPNGCMLAIAGLRTGHDKLVEAEKPGAVVREIHPDHSLGPVYTLIDFSSFPAAPPDFQKSPDPDFITACQQLLANRPFLEQQDHGVLLGPNKMPWHKTASKNFARAFCFFHRQDGALVGIGKKGWAILSTDNGQTWSAPTHLNSYPSGNAKEWITATADHRYAWLHDPFDTDRYPLVLLTSDDGIRFDQMRAVHGELPPMRYDGLNKTPGPQYVRGISEWATDYSRTDTALWVAYSVNKEDIWVSRIPVPIRANVTDPTAEIWNTYSPQWAAVTQQPDKTLRLQDRDPYDYARADRLFPQTKKLSLTFTVLPIQLNGGTLEIEITAPFGDLRPIRLILSANGTIASATDTTSTKLSTYSLNENLNFKIDADTTAQKFSLTLNDRALLIDHPFAQPADTLTRITFRTGPYRGVESTSPIDPATDKPLPPTVFQISAPLTPSPGL